MAYFQGLLIGLAFVAPIGMQNIYVFNNGLSYRLSRALLYTFLVWLFDALFCFAAFYGIGAIVNRNQIVKIIIMVIGGGLTVYIGWNIIRSANQRALTSDNHHITIKQAIMTAIVVSWANPQALIDGTMMLGASRGTLTTAESIFFIIGVITSSFVWDLGMTSAFNLLRYRMPAKLLVWINLISGVIVLGYGGFLIVNGIQQII
ncbi:LysE/ArgO family amino acid transporter [uncultured Limosilactobacillus sp.]|uniref:LysE/ArgO family amino acid transporter n=1 Tax=uncultured Limosilactobacillus sp. TaxID=2837629 RepID=UPI0025EB2392|nr:LysE family transporter [uncultured Limosilactobacillus sp.]